MEDVIVTEEILGRKKEKAMEDVIVTEKFLGSGTYGKVHRGVLKNGRLVAVKSSTTSHSTSLQREREILSWLKPCKDVVRCMGAFRTKESNQEPTYNLVLEYAPTGSLRSLMEKRGRQLPEQEVRDYTRSILRGLCCIHRKGFVHCDLKPGNILVFPGRDGGNIVKIADFGLSKETGKVCAGLRGTLRYMSPEAIDYYEHEPPLDIWALGCTVIEMLTGKPALSGCPSTEEIIERIVFNREIPSVPKNMSECGKDFLKKCFIRNPRKRWTAEKLMQHPFVA